MRHCKSIFALILSLAITLTVADTAAAVTIGSHQIRLGLDPANGELLISSRLELENPDFQESFHLSLTSRAQLKSVSAIKDFERHQVSYTPVAGDSLLLQLPHEVRKDKWLTLELEYIVSIGKMTASVMVLDHGHRWYPTILEQLSRVSLMVQVPEGVDVFASADLMSREDKEGYTEYHWQSAIPILKMMVAVSRPGLYQRWVRECDDVEVLVCSDTADNDIAEKLLDDVCELVTYYQKQIGPFPGGQLRLLKVTGVRSVSVGTGLIVMGEGAVDKYRSADISSIRLAVASQWYGSAVFGEYRRPGFWFVTASLPKYLELMYLKALNGDEEYSQALEQTIESYETAAGDAFDVAIADIADVDSRVKMNIILSKGPYVIARFVDKIGEDKWGNILKTFYQEYRGKTLSYRDLMDRLSRMDLDESALDEFRSGLSQTGMPPDKK